MKILRSVGCLALVLVMLVSMTSCPLLAGKSQPKTKTYWTYFDTVSNIHSFAGDSEEQFAERCQGAAAVLSDYHKLFDIYNEYEGINNLATVNKNAGGEPVAVDGRLVEFLVYTKELYELTGGEMNVMMGSVLRLWHECRQEATESSKNARIPTEGELREAALHTGISLLEIDVENSTVRISDPEASIDVGAVGKGYATERAAEYLESVGAESYVLDIGGNLRIIGHKPDGSGWSTGVRSPFDAEKYAIILNIADIACVTSGDYERYYTVNGKRYHHIIDKDTLMPSAYFSSVTVITADSGLADALSTALFSMSYEDGLYLIERIDAEVEAFWIKANGTEYKTEDLEKYILKEVD